MKLTIDILLSNCSSVIISPSKFVNENDGTCPMIPILSILDLVALSITKNPKDPSIKINKNAITSFLFRLFILQSIIQYNYYSYKPR